MSDWVEISATYAPVRGDVLSVELFNNPDIYVVELIKRVKGDIWLVREDKSFHQDFLLNREMIKKILLNKEFYDRRIHIWQMRLDECMNEIAKLRAERLKKYG